jgi:hypothetical protein
MQKMNVPKCGCCAGSVAIQGETESETWVAPMQEKLVLTPLVMVWLCPNKAS